MKRIVILGSTGSIGVQTLDVVRRYPDRLAVVGLAARRQQTLAEQSHEFTVPYVSIGCTDVSAEFPKSTTVLTDPSSLETLATLPEADIVVVATVGRAGLFATIAALKAGKRVGLANKEVLVMAGGIVSELACRYGGMLVPIDSEHSALWQCLVGEDIRNVHELILTASGGALRHRTREELSAVTPAEALRHPNWQMGPKVTIDSATLMNKGLEVIEAHWLFDCPYDRIRIAIHPTSVVHSLVQFSDGSVKAQIGKTDMRLPIQYALSHPERWERPEMQIDITKVGTLEFSEPDMSRYPCLRLALESARRGGTYPAALCGADEVAVDLFIGGSIPLTGIAELVEGVLHEHKAVDMPDLETLVAADDRARARCRDLARARGWI